MPLRTCLSILTAALLIGGCGGPSKPADSRPKPVNILGESVVDEGDHAGTIRVFSKRLAETPKDHDQYPATLEKLALAHSDLADELEQRSLGAPPNKAEPLLLEAQGHHQEAATLYQRLADEVPNYEGLPGVLVILAYEYQILGDAERNAATLQLLLERYPQSEYAADAELGLAEAAFYRQELTAAVAGYEAVIARDPASDRAQYARYKLAWSHYNLGAHNDAIELIVQLVNAPTSSPELAREARRDAVVIFADSSQDPTVAPELFAMLSNDPGEIAAMLGLLVQLYEQKGKVDAAEAIRALSKGPAEN